MQCTNCKSELPAKVKFCPECGTAAPVETQPGSVTLGNNSQLGGHRQTGDNITVGDIKNSTGTAIGKNINQKIQIGSGPSRDEIVKVFKEISEKIDTMQAGPKKAQAEMAVAGLVDETNKGDEADESNVGEWMKLLAQAASDAFEVAVAAFANPIAGLGLAFKKVADRAKQEKGK